MGRASVVSRATCYGLEGMGIAFWWREVLHIHMDRTWDPPSLLYNGYWVSFLGIKQPGRGINHLPPSSTKVKKKRVELYLYSPSETSWQIIGLTISFTFTFRGIFLCVFTYVNTGLSKDK